MSQHNSDRTEVKPPRGGRGGGSAHPAELLQQPVVLLGELADGLGLVPVGLPQLDLVALQLALQMLDVRLQLGHASLPLPLSALQTPTQLVLLLLQVLLGNRGQGHFSGKAFYPALNLTFS